MSIVANTQMRRNITLRTVEKKTSLINELIYKQREIPTVVKVIIHFLTGVVHLYIFEWNCPQTVVGKLFDFHLTRCT